jgi:hypothetical protein
MLITEKNKLVEDEFLFSKNKTYLKKSASYVFNLYVHPANYTVLSALNMLLNVMYLYLSVLI